jgi:hypothetical protein
MQNHMFKQEEGSHTWGSWSSEKWCCVASLEFPNTSNEHSAFTFKGQRVHNRKYQTSNISSYPRRTESSKTLLWLTQISYSFTELFTNSIPMCEQISCAPQTLVMYVQHKSKKYTVFCIISMPWSGNVMQLLWAQLQHKPKYEVAPNIWQLHLSHWDI